jgi:O-antigen/teichoic acid export membrane protein
MLFTARSGTIRTAGTLFEYGSRFLIAFLLARFLGAEQYGLYQLTLVAGAIAANLALFGLDDALVRYIPILTSRRDEAGVWGTLQISLGISMSLSMFMAAGLYFLSAPIADSVFHAPELAPLLRVISVLVPFLALSQMLAKASLGFKKVEYIVLAQNFVQTIVRVALIGLLGLLGLSTLFAVIVYGVSDVAASAVMFYFLNREFSFRRPLRAARYHFRKILSFAWPLWLAGLLSTFRSNIETVLLGALNTVGSVGIYAIATKINLVGGTFFASITTTAKPVIAELHSQGERKQLERLYQTTSRWAFEVNMPVFLTTVLYAAPILLIFGESFVAGAPALVLLACADFINIATGICGAIIEMSGYAKTKLFNSMFQIGLMTISSLIFIPRYGLVGTALAALVSIGTINVLRVSQVWWRLRILPYNRSFIKPVTAGVVAAAATLVLRQWLPAETRLLYLIIDVLAIFVVYAGVILLLGLPDEERLVLTRVRSRASSLLSRR